MSPLCHVAAESGTAVATGLQLLGQFDRHDARAHEDEYSVERFGLEDARQGVDLMLLATHHPVMLGDGGGHRGALFDGDVFGVAQVLAGDSADGRRQGRRKQCGLSFRWCLLQDPLDIVDEAHTQHLVSLIQDQTAQLVEAQCLAAHVIHHPSGCAHHNMNATPE